MIYELSNDISCKDMKGLFLMYDGSKGAKVCKRGGGRNCQVGNFPLEIELQCAQCFVTNFKQP